MCFMWLAEGWICGISMSCETANTQTDVTIITIIIIKWTTNMTWIFMGYLQSVKWFIGCSEFRMLISTRIAETIVHNNENIDDSLKMVWILLLEADYHV